MTIAGVATRDSLHGFPKIAGVAHRWMQARKCFAMQFTEPSRNDDSELAGAAAVDGNEIGAGHACDDLPNHSSGRYGSDFFDACATALRVAAASLALRLAAWVAANSTGQPVRDDGMAHRHAAMVLRYPPR